MKDIEPKELKRMMDAGEKVVLLDVREPFEERICRLDGSVLIPLGQLPRRHSELDSSAATVVYCHTGVRSMYASQLLERSGFKKVMNLRGGVEAWANQVDPKMRRY